MFLYTGDNERNRRHSPCLRRVTLFIARAQENNAQKGTPQFKGRYKIAAGFLCLFIATSLAGTTSVSPVHAIDRLIPFSAKLKSASSGDLVPDGTYSITFRLYDVASGGTEQWSETQTVQVSQGAISTNLGASTPIPTSVTFNDVTYLGIQVGSDPEASPRKRLGSVPAAFNAEALAGATASTSGAANTIPILDSTGSLTLQGGATIGNAILPASSGINLGSSSAKFGTVYADTLAVDAATINGTTSEFFAINTDQATNNTEDAGVRFYLGPTLNTYAALQWTASSNRFDLFSRTDLGTLGNIRVANTTINGSIDVSGAATFTSTLSVASNFTVNTSKFVVTASSGNTAIAGTLTVTGDTALATISTSGLASLNSVSTSGSAVVGTTLNVTGLTTLGQLAVNGDGTPGNTDITLGDASTDQIVVNAGVASNLLPIADNTYDLGSASKRWGNFYAANAVFDQLTTPNTTSNQFVINSDNATADTEDATLEFERGSVAPNAIIGWNSTSDYLYANQNFVFQGGTTFGDASGDTVTSAAATWTFSNATAVNLASATAALNFSSGLLKLDTSNSRVGINVGSNTPAATLHILNTTEQQRLGYDLSNYFSTTVSSAGAVTFDAVGSSAGFNFSDFLGIGVAPTSKLHIAGNVSASSWTTAGIQLQAAAATYTDTSGSGTIASRVANSFGQPTFASSSAVTLTNSATIYIADSPAQGSNTTISNAWALWVAAGNVKFDGSNVTYGSATTVSLATSTTALNFGSGLLDLDTSNNRVGIGTTAPKTKLHVEDNGGGITLSTGAAGEVYQTFRSSVANSLWDRWHYNSATANLTFEKNTNGNDSGSNFDTTTPWLTLGWNTESLAVNSATLGQFTSRSGAAFSSTSTAGYFWGNAASSSTNAIQAGLQVWVDGVNNGSGAKNIGVYVENVTGGTNNYDAIFNGSATVGIGTTTPTGKLTVTTKGTPDQNAWGTSGILFQAGAATVRDQSTAASGTAASEVFNSFGQPTLSAFNSNVTTTDAATVYIQNAPTAGTNMTISNAWALWVDAGNVRFDGALTVAGVTSSGTNTFSDTTTLSKSGANALAVTGVPATSTTSSLVQLGSTIASGSANGTYLSVNSGSGYTGDLANLQVNGASRFKVGSDGTLSVTNGSNQTSTLTTGGSGVGSGYFQVQASGTNSIIFNVRDCCNNILTVGPSSTASSFSYDLTVGSKLSIGTGTLQSAQLYTSGNFSRTSWTTNGTQIQAAASTFTDTNGSGTIASRVANSLAQPTFASSNSVTTTDAATLYLADAPAQGTNTTITNAYALWIDDGTFRFDGHLKSAFASTPTAGVTGTGYSGASMGTGSTDTKGIISATVGAAAGTLTVTFSTAYKSAPVCTISPASAAAQVDVGKMYVTASTTILTINIVATPTGGSETWNYVCIE